MAQPWSDSCILLQTISDEIDPAQRSLQSYNEAANQVPTIPRAFPATPVLFDTIDGIRLAAQAERAPGISIVGFGVDVA